MELQSLFTAHNIELILISALSVFLILVGMQWWRDFMKGLDGSQKRRARDYFMVWTMTCAFVSVAMLLSLQQVIINFISGDYSLVSATMSGSAIFMVAAFVPGLVFELILQRSFAPTGKLMRRAHWQLIGSTLVCGFIGATTTHIYAELISAGDEADVVAVNIDDVEGIVPDVQDPQSLQNP